jgi:hypothetical protein
MILPAALLAFEARRKGYNPAAWFLAGGILGYAVLAFLPDTSPLLGRDRPDAESRRQVGNRIGIGITILSVLLCVLSGIIFSSNAFRALPTLPPPSEALERGSVAFPPSHHRANNPSAAQSSVRDVTGISKAQRSMLGRSRTTADP